jgi:putative addiction module component (TIGR02574 family)
MSRNSEEILKQAMALSAEERAELADQLLGSIEPEDEGVEAAWDAEIQRRVEELKAGSVSTVPWAEVRAALAAKI